MIRILNDGISIENGKITLNTDIDSPNDIINFVHPEIYKSNFGGNIYYFGYTFNDNIGRKDRTAIIKWLKGIGEDVIDNSSLRKFIRKPLNVLNKVENLSTFDAILYPRSNRSNLTKAIVNEIGKIAQHTTKKNSFELIKELSKFPNKEAENAIKAIQGDKLLIVDDINTSGSTLTEILRIVYNINNKCEIYIFTLIGKE